MFKLETIEGIKKQIVNIGKSGVRLVVAIQIAAMQVLAHAVKHGDITVAQSLVDAVPKHLKASLVAWLEDNGPFRYSKESKALTFFKGNAALKKAGIAVPGEVTVEYMAQLPRWEVAKKAAEPRSRYDMSEEADRFISRMRKLAADANIEVQHKELLEDLTSAYNRYQAKLVLGAAVDTPEVSADGTVRTDFGDCPVIPGTTTPDPVKLAELVLAAA